MLKRVPPTNGDKETLETSLRDLDSGGDAKAGATGDCDGGGTPELFSSYIRTFETFADKDPKFARTLDGLCSGMLGREMLSEPMEAIVREYEKYKSSPLFGKLSSEDKERYTKQLQIYKQITTIYTSKQQDMTDEQKKKVQDLLIEVQACGSPPDEVLAAIHGDKDEEEDEEGENFQELMKTFGLEMPLDKAEADMLSHLAKPGELDGTLREMSEEFSGRAPQKAEEQPCRQQ